MSAVAAESVRARLGALRGRGLASGAHEASVADAQLLRASRGEPAAREEHEAPTGLRVLRQRHPLAHAHGSRNLAHLREALARGRSQPGWREHAEAMMRERDFLEPLERGALFIDTETTGLSGGAGTLAWLVGLAWFETSSDGCGEELVLEQLVMSRMRDEAELLDLLRPRMEAAEVLVSFNGKSFDVPLIETRYVLNRRRAPPRRLHLDMLHPSRRVFGVGLEDVRLPTLERSVLGFVREDDIPSEHVPAVWFEHLRTGRLDDVMRVARHNAWDLLSLVALSGALLELALPDVRPAGASVHHDALELAEQRLRAGDAEAAVAWLGASSCDPARVVGVRRHLRRARAAKRMLGASAAEQAWRDALDLPGAGAAPYEELAKVLEHERRDHAGAGEVVREALARFGHDDGVGPRLRHRLARLERRIDQSPRQGRDGACSSPCSTPPSP